MNNLVAAPGKGQYLVEYVHNNAHIVQTPGGDVLFHSPPETLKHLFAKGIAVPDIIVLPPDIPAGQELGSSGFVRKGINYASVEFILYYNFFVAGAKRTRIITLTNRQAERVKIILREVISGPFHMFPGNEYTWLQDECNYVTFFKPIGKSPNANDLAEIVSMENGNIPLGNDISLGHNGQEFLFYNHADLEFAFAPDLTQPAMPLRVSPPTPLIKQEITLQFVGSGDGFDPNEITTCFLAYMQNNGETRTILFDAAAYLSIRLGNLGVSLGQISEIVITHVHEDHIAGLPELLLMGQTRLKLITSTLVHASLVKLLAAALAISEDDVQALFDFYRLDPGNPLDIHGLKFQSSYAVHSIPTIALRVNGLYYSGDMVYDEEWFLKLEKEEIISQERRLDLVNFANDAVVLIQDVGGGSIHTTLTTEVFKTLVSKGQHLILAHTNKRIFPEGGESFSENVQFATGGLVKAIGDLISHEEDAYRLETLSSCTLFSRLPLEERIEYAKKAKILEFQPGDVIMNYGDPFDGSTYVVHSGLLEIWVDGRCILVIGRGNTVGERGALYGDPRTGTVIARTKVELLCLDQDLFNAIAERLGLREAFARAEWLWRNPGFGHITWGMLLDLALDFVPRLLQPGETIFEYGDPSGVSYLLVSGVLGLKNKRGESLATFYEPGEFFGGKTALAGKVHKSTVEAIQPTEVWALPISGLQRLQMIYPNVLLHLKAVDIG